MAGDSFPTGQADPVNVLSKIPPTRYDPSVKPPVQHAANQAYRLLRNDIVTGIISAGSHLAETDLAEQYGFSRTPIRESLRRLQAEGLVEVFPHRGARVVDWHNFDVEGIYDLRVAIESFVARRAAVRLDSSGISKLSTLCDEMERATETVQTGDIDTASKFADLNAQFHGSIADAAGAEYVIPARNVLVVLPLILQALHNFAPVGYQRSNQHHRELLEAFAYADSDWASAIMTTHVLASKTILMARLKNQKQADTGITPD